MEAKYIFIINCICYRVRMQLFFKNIFCSCIAGFFT